MNKLSILWLCITLVACAPKLRSNITKGLPALSTNALVIVLDNADDQVIDGEKVGELKAVDGGFSENCTYYENIQNLKAMARSFGANIIKITKQAAPDKKSTCFRLWADIYKVANPKPYENEIE
ncbi:hypothetical protein OAE07_05605 [Winogradskyella sp.]|nr:hypothetical protein [Winogradskyella sp.]MDC1504966.1 hypothetical protein [Winogradskyella sp.]